MPEYLDYLWYIIPGTLLLLPLILTDKFEIFHSQFGCFILIPFLILAFTCGYILHRVYRILYYHVLRDRRELIKFLRKELQNKLNIKLDGKRTEYYYNYFIYSSHKEKIKSRISKIKIQSQYCSSIFSSSLASFLALVFLVIFTMNHLLITFYVVVLIILIWDYRISFKWLNENEKIVIKNNFKEFKANEIERGSEEMVSNETIWKSRTFLFFILFSLFITVAVISNFIWDFNIPLVNLECLADSINASNEKGMIVNNLGIMLGSMVTGFAALLGLLATAYVFYARILRNDIERVRKYYEELVENLCKNGTKLYKNFEKDFKKINEILDEGLGKYPKELNIDKICEKFKKMSKIAKISKMIKF